MGTTKLQGTKECDPEWIVEIVNGFLDKDINNLSDYQKEMLRDQYLEYLRDGFKPKKALEKALTIVLCFNYTDP